MFKDGDVGFVIVAFIMGQTALKVGEADQRVKKHPYIDAKTESYRRNYKPKTLKTSTPYSHGSVR